MNKIVVIFLVGIVISVLFFCNSIFYDEKIDYKKIDTGFTPEQIWDIINGEDVGIVIINGGDVNGNSRK